MIFSLCSKNLKSNTRKILLEALLSLRLNFSTKYFADCTGERDHLIFYDGSSTNDPVLAKFCGGDWLPRVVSR